MKRRNMKYLATTYMQDSKLVEMNKGLRFIYMRTARQSTFSSIATVSTGVCGILSVMAVSRNAVC